MTSMFTMSLWSDAVQFSRQHCILTVQPGVQWAGRSAPCQIHSDAHNDSHLHHEAVCLFATHIPCLALQALSACQYQTSCIVACALPGLADVLPTSNMLLCKAACPHCFLMTIPGSISQCSASGKQHPMLDFAAPVNSDCQSWQQLHFCCQHSAVSTTESSKL